MIANLFSKTRPINYALLAVMLIVSYFLFQFCRENIVYNAESYLFLLVNFGLIIFSLILTNFISLKNTLTKNDHFALLLFLIFVLFFPTILQNFSILLSNLFLLLALRRLISLKSLVSPKEKIFDASFWIFLSAIFHFWSIIYIVLVFLSIIYHSGKDYKNWLLPFVSFMCVWLLYIFFNLIFYDTYQVEKSLFSVDFTFFNNQNLYQNMAFSVYVSISVLFFASQIIQYPNKPLNMQSSYKQVYFSFILAMAIYVFSANKTNDLLIYSFAPLSILGANMFEKMEDTIYKEVSLWLLFLIGLFFFIMQL
jgi:Family of unknown function (DUF6427)